MNNFFLLFVVLFTTFNFAISFSKETVEKTTFITTASGSKIEVWKGEINISLLPKATRAQVNALKAYISKHKGVILKADAQYLEVRFSDKEFPIMLVELEKIAGVFTADAKVVEAIPEENE